MYSAQGSSIFLLRSCNFFDELFIIRLSDAREGVRKVCGDEVADKIKPLWGLNEEGEINGCYGDLGCHGLWYIMGELRLNHGLKFEQNSLISFGYIGNLALSRFHSKHIALRESPSICC